MLSFRRLFQGVAAVMLLQPGFATSFNSQIQFGAKRGDKEESPEGKDLFYATMHVPRNTTGGEKSLPVVHQDGRLYAMRDKDPT